MIAAFSLHPALIVAAAVAVVLLCIVIRYRVSLTTDYPARAANRKAMRDIVFRLRAGEDDPAIIEDRVLPLLRSHYQLAPDAPAEAIAKLIRTQHPHLAADILPPAKPRSNAKPRRIDPQSLANHLSRIPF